MTRVICVSSGKGGVGKTTICANLAAALAHLGKKVIAVDCNLTTSNLGLHLGIPMYPVTLHDVIGEGKNIKSAIYNHPSGFKVLPADIAIRKGTPQSSKLLDVFYKLTGSADFVLVDSAAGLGREALAAIEASDEVVTVTNPELPALIDALKLSTYSNKFGTKNLGMILNRVRYAKHEVTRKDAEQFLNLPMLGLVNEDENVKHAIAKRVPVVEYKPRSRAARQIKGIAAKLVGQEYHGEHWWVRLAHALRD